MDTTAPGGVYDEDNRARGATNAEEVTKVLRDLLPDSLVKEALSSTWDREAQILGMHPDLVVIHRSSFFHPLNGELGFGSPLFPNDAAKTKWELLYRMADDKLFSFLGLVGTVRPHTKFLVYSRGTDPNWLKPEFRMRWVTMLEQRFPAVKGRVTTMLIVGGKAGTFRDPQVAEELRSHVKRILGLQESVR